MKYNISPSCFFLSCTVLMHPLDPNLAGQAPQREEEEGSQRYSLPASLASIDTRAPGRHPSWLQMVCPWPHPCPQPETACLHIFISTYREFWGDGEFLEMLLVRLVKLVKTAAAKWIRVEISPCQLWHGYLPESTQRKGERIGGYWEDSVCVAMPSVYKCKSLVEKHINETF